MGLFCGNPLSLASILNRPGVLGASATRSPLIYYDYGRHSVSTRLFLTFGHTAHKYNGGFRQHVPQGLAQQHNNGLAEQTSRHAYIKLNA